ncbi:unnamed protein product [Pylaiella littoralis]
MYLTNIGTMHTSKGQLSVFTLLPGGRSVHDVRRLFVIGQDSECQGDGRSFVLKKLTVVMIFQLLSASEDKQGGSYTVDYHSTWIICVRVSVILLVFPCFCER